MVYYNEFDPKLAPWLYELMDAGLIAPGYVDTRSIEDVAPDDLREFTQCHFFAGIGGWPYALRLAGWPDDRPVWTGSCPCQPFSAAGKGAGFADERHLWPAWHWLISQCRPGVIFGEQVASKDGLAWLDLVLTDLEVAGYAAGAVDLCAAGVGAPHIRQRLWIVADTDAPGRGEQRLSGLLDGERSPQWHDADRCGAIRGLADADGGHAGAERQQRGRIPGGAGGPDARQATERAGIRAGPWSTVEWVQCRDGKARPVKPGVQPLAAGLSGRVGVLRGAGNAIVPQVAEQVIRAYLENIN